MSWTKRLLRLAVLVSVVCLPAEAARKPLPTPEDRIHGRLSAAREQAGFPAPARRDELDALALSRAALIAARPAGKRLGGTTSVGEALKASGILYRNSLERLILLRNMDQVSGVMERWQAQSGAWRKATTMELDGAGYGTARAEDGWIVFVAILVQDLAIRDSAEEIAALEQAVAEGVNRIRKEHGLEELRQMDDLAGAARAHSRNMVARDFFSHSDPLGSLPAGRVRAAGIDFRGVAENLTMNNNPDTPAEQAVRDWMGSPGHRKNILDDDFEITGVGVAVSDDGHYYFTQLFLAP